MSNKNKVEETKEFENAEATAAPAEGATTEAAAAAGDSDGRHVVITDPDTNQPIKRVDFIKREVITKGRQRGEVAKQLSTIQGKKVPYQIVFAATKGFKPKKPDAPAAEGAATSEGAEQAVAAE